MLPYLLVSLQGNPVVTVILRIIAGFGYYIIGFLFTRGSAAMKMKMELPVGVILILIGFLNLVLFNFETGYSFFQGIFTSPVLSLICSICSSIGFILLVRVLDQKQTSNRVTKLLNYCGKNSLVIMLVHPTILNCIIRPLNNIINRSQGFWNAALSLLVFAMVVIAEVPFVWLINNKLPWIIGKTKK